MHYYGNSIGIQGNKTLLIVVALKQTTTAAFERVELSTTGEYYMTSVGMIVMDCYCGAELYYVGDNAEGRSPDKIIGQLKDQLGSANIGFFSSADGAYGECPFCGLIYELPDPELMEWLPFMNSTNFSSALTEMQRSGGRQPGHFPGATHSGPYLS